MYCVCVHLFDIVEVCVCVCVPARTEQETQEVRRQTDRQMDRQVLNPNPLQGHSTETFNLKCSWNLKLN